MHIEINAGGLGAGIAVAEYQLNMSGFISDAEDMIASFKAVTGRVCELSGGVGSLQDPLEELEARIALEEQRLQTARDVRKKSNDFLDLAVRVDSQVADLVEVNQEEFYRVNPWLRPPEPEEKAWYEEAWDWLCGVGEAVKEGLEEFVDWAGETLKNAWDGLVEFYNEHKKIIDTILVVVGAVLTIAAIIGTGGWALAGMTSLIMAIGGCSAATAATISAAIAVTAIVTTSATAILDIVDIWCEIDNPIFNFVQNSFRFVSAVTTFVYTVGSSISRHFTLDGRRTIQVNGKTVVTDNKTFDPNFIDPQGRSNIQRMRQGLAPIGHDGKSVNMHHIFQTDRSPVIQMSASYHQKFYSLLHKNTGQSPSLINRPVFDTWRNNFWIWFGNNF